MNLYFRMLWAILCGLLGKKTKDIYFLSKLNFRVLPNDIDINIHLNNGKYLTIMDIGRIDLMVRTGLIKQIIKHRWQPLVAAAVISYRRPIGFFKKYELYTEVAHWDEKWFYIRQEFIFDGKIAALAYVKVCLGLGKSTVPTQTILQHLQVPDQKRLAPEAVIRIFDLKSDSLKDRQNLFAGKEGKVP